MCWLIPSLECNISSVIVGRQWPLHSNMSWNVPAINSLTPRRLGCHFKTTIFNLVFLIGTFTSSKDNALRWMPRDFTDNKSTLVQVMAWCRQAASHNLSQCWPSFMSPNGVTRPQWVEGPYFYRTHGRMCEINWVTLEYNDAVTHRNVALQTLIWNKFSCMKIAVFWFEFHSSFPNVHATTRKHWFRWWLGIGQATRHHLTNDGLDNQLLHGRFAAM